MGTVGSVCDVEIVNDALVEVGDGLTEERTIRAPPLTHCKCFNCGGVLEFPRSASGQVMKCYHCGLETWLHGPRPENDETPKGHEAPTELIQGIAKLPPSVVPRAPIPTPELTRKELFRITMVVVAAVVVAAHLLCLLLAIFEGPMSRRNRTPDSLRPAPIQSTGR